MEEKSYDENKIEEENFSIHEDIDKVDSNDGEDEYGYSDDGEDGKVKEEKKPSFTGGE